MLKIYRISFKDLSKSLSDSKRHGKTLIRARDEPQAQKRFAKIHPNKEIYVTEQIERKNRAG